MKTTFDGKDVKPYYQARRYVYRCLAQILSGDIDSGADYLNEDLADEFDVRRAHEAARKVIKEPCISGYFPFARLGCSHSPE